MRRWIPLLVFLLASAVSHAQDVPPVADEEPPPEPKEEGGPPAPYRLSLSFDDGPLAVLENRARFGDDGTWFDFREDGGQDVLFPVVRLSATLVVDGKHVLRGLYQPFSLRTVATLDEPLVVDGQTFAAGTPMGLRYGFSFWRGSWRYRWGRADRRVELGGGLQIRNADIAFEALDGSRLAVEGDVGPVPLLEAGGRLPVGRGVWVGMDFEGIWAPVRYLNASRSDVEGLFLETELLAGVDLPPWGEAFVLVRYFGGGAAGTGADGYSANWLHTVALTAGFALQLEAAPNRSGR